MTNSGKLAAALSRASKVVSGHKSLLSGTALTAFVVAGLFSPMSMEQAMAACGNDVAPPSTTTFTCSGSDTDGHTIGTFVGLPISGNTLNINSAIQTAASISNAAGKVALTVVVQDGADWTFSGTDQNNSITAVNANAIVFGAAGKNTGSTIDIDYAGKVMATNGNALLGVYTNGGVADLTFGATAVITATGTTDLLGVPVTGGGIVLSNLGDKNSVVDWDVTNHGTVYAQNDAIAMYNLTGKGEHTVVNDGSLGTALSPLNGSAIVIVAANAAANATVTNDDGDIVTKGKGGLGGIYGAVGVAVGGTATVNNLKGNITAIDSSGVLILSGGKAQFLGSTGTVSAASGFGISATSTTGNSIVESGKTDVTDGLGIVALATKGDASVTTYGATTVGGKNGLIAITVTGAGQATADLKAQTVKNTTGAGVTVIAGTGDATVLGKGSTVDAAKTFGISALSTAADAIIVSGTVTVADGVGIVATALDKTGDAKIDTWGNTTVGGTLGLLAVNALGGNTATVDLHERTVTNKTGSGVNAVGGLGDATVQGKGSTVDAAKGFGISALSTAADAIIVSGTVTVADGVGIVATALDKTGDAKIDTWGDTTVGGTLGLLAVNALGGNTATVDLHERTVTNKTGSGVNASAILGDAIVKGKNSTVNAALGFGVNAISTGADALVDSGTVTVLDGVGVFATALDKTGDAKIDTWGDTTVGGKLGLLAVGATGGNTATVDLHERTVKNTTGSGVSAIAGLGDATVKGIGSTVEAQAGFGVNGTSLLGNVDIDSGIVTLKDGLKLGSGVQALASDGNATVDTWGVVTVNNALAGAIATAINGDANVTTHATVAVTDGVYGAAAFATKGSAHVVVGGDIDPPSIGAQASVIFGDGDATVDVLDTYTVEANLIGVVASSTFGKGEVVVNIGDDDADADGAAVVSKGGGILTTKLEGEGDIEINVTKNSSVLGALSGVTILAGTLGDTGNNSATLNNFGSIQSSSLLPVIGSATDGDLTVNNNAGGLIQNTSGNWAAIAVASAAGGSNTITNNGSITGAVELYGDDGNTFTNNSGNTWNFSGINLFVTGGNNLFTNTVNGVANAKNSATFFVSAGNSTIDNAGLSFNDGLNVYSFATKGDSTVNNSGTWRVNGSTYIADLDDIDFNNSNLLDMEDGAVNDYMEITSATGSADFNASGNSTFRFDAQLTPGGDADFLFIDGNVSGATFVDVNDLDFFLPGQYDPNGVQFAQVGEYSDVGDFYTNGGIDKGLFRYDAYLLPDYNSSSGDNEWYLANVLDREAYEFPVIASGTDALWNQSTGTWLDRTADLRSAFGETGSGIVDLKNEGAVAATPGNVTPGFWLKAFGGTSQRDMSNVSAPPPNMLGPSYQFDDTYNQNFYGFMAGVDFGKESVTTSGANEAWIFGLLGGYSGSKMDFDNSTTEADYSAGSVGAYLTYLNGGLFVDATIKADFGSIDYSTDAGGGFSDSASADYTSVGGVIDAGYRFNMASGWFIEPKATLSYVSTEIDDITVLGTSVSFDDGDSFRGRLGARVGTAIVNGGNVIEPYIEASVWNEFDGNYKATLFSSGFEVPVGHDAGGVYGEVTAGASVINVGNGWSGFAKGAVQFGDENFLGFSGNLGLRKAF